MARAIDMFGDDASLQEHWVRRVLASIIDWVLISVVTSSLLIGLPLFLGLGLGISIWSPYTLVAGLLPFAYFGLMEGATNGRTAGKALMSLQTVGTVGELDMQKALVRNISKLYGLFLLLDLALGILGEGDPRQKFLDRVSKTVVVRTDVHETFRGVYPPAGQFSVFERRDTQPAEPATTGPATAYSGRTKECSTCKGQATLIEGIDRWFCYHCRKYI